LNFSFPSAEDNMKILMTGSSGMVGGALFARLRAEGHTIAPLVRLPRVAGPGEVAWNPDSGQLDLAAAAGADAVVNLAGANIGEGRWSEGRKQVLRSSRIDSTRRLVDALARLEPRPKTFVSASAVGYYGDRGDERLTEESSPGGNFLAWLVREWEAEARRAESLGMRVVILRFGVILTPKGGALAQMLGPFRMGVGGRLGSGRQWMSWIALEDVVGILRDALANGERSGVYNAVAPEPVTNAQFTRALGRAVHRPTPFPVPRFALRLLFGEMADGMLLASQRVEPARLAAAGYSYSYPGLEPTLLKLLSSH
jgi:uncharacterized protein (TIGR01777 family)